MAAAGASAGLAAAPARARVASATAKIVDLRVDYIDRPLGLENLTPRFSWAVASKAKDVRQAAYRIQVAADEAALASGPWTWDSGKVASRRSFDIAYEGPQLASRQRRAWRVTLWLEGSDVPIVSAGSGPRWRSMTCRTARSLPRKRGTSERLLPFSWMK